VAERSAPPEGERDAAGAEEAALTGGNVGGVQGSGGVGTGDAARAHRLVESVGAGAGVGGGRGPGRVLLQGQSFSAFPRRSVRALRRCADGREVASIARLHGTEEG
jgi:hypothetical protein